MEEQQHIYTAEDIARYHNGSLSAQEMHRLERAALDDPFLADALEGYVHAPDPLADVAELRTRLKRRTDKKVFTLPLARALRIAALVVVVAGFSWIAYQYTVDNNNVALSHEAKEPLRQENGDTAHTTSTTLTEPSETDQSVVVQKQVPAQKTAIRKRAERLTTAAEAENNLGNELENRESDAAAQTSVAAPVRAAAKEDLVLQQTNLPDSRRITGQVVDVNNVAVPHATVQLLNQKLAVQTAADGTFSIPAPDTAVRVTVHSVGYQESQAFLRNSTSNKVVLQPSDNALNEVVVTGYGKARRAESTSRITLDGATAVAGAATYERYVVENLKPFSSEYARVNGTVELDFDIDASGKPVDIKVEKSLCTPCDAEVIRVISSGPLLKKTKKNRRARVRIRF